MLRTTIALLALAAPVMALASSDVRTKSSIFVERIDPEGSGARRVRLEPARQVSPGERLIYVVEYRNMGNWGPLGTLRVSLGDGSWRPANPDDVTHLRWQVGDRLMQGETRRVTFRAIVR